MVKLIIMILNLFIKMKKILLIDIKPLFDNYFKSIKGYEFKNYEIVFEDSLYPYRDTSFSKR